MKDKRAYYTCPILAALAAQYHGIRFVDKEGQRLVFNLTSSGVIWHWFQSTTLEEYTNNMWYIAPESMHLLDPQLDDLAWWTLGDGKALGLATPMLISQGGCVEIVQRNNIPFPWPEFWGVE
jgi:hypothetical protein